MSDNDKIRVYIDVQEYAQDFEDIGAAYLFVETCDHEKSVVATVVSINLEGCITRFIVNVKGPGEQIKNALTKWIALKNNDCLNELEDFVDNMIYSVGKKGE